jgi:hypothetical protein
MRFPAVIAACGVLVACGNTAPPRPATSAREQSARFVKPPLVIARPGGSVEAWVRLNRPLHDNEGRLADDPGQAAEIEIPGTTRDIPGLYRDDLHPTCYGQDFDGRVTDGDPVEVTLVLGLDERISATARARAWTPVRNPLRALGCPSDQGATRRCRGEARARSFDGIEAKSATNASCRAALAVMRSVGRWASEGCPGTLCAGAHPINHGDRCTVDLVGEAAWQITCVHGRRTVRGFAAD